MRRVKRRTAQRLQNRNPSPSALVSRILCEKNKRATCSRTAHSGGIVGDSEVIQLGIVRISTGKSASVYRRFGTVQSVIVVGHPEAIQIAEHQSVNKYPTNRSRTESSIKSRSRSALCSH